MIRLQNVVAKRLMQCKSCDSDIGHTIQSVDAMVAQICQQDTHKLHMCSKHACSKQNGYYRSCILVQIKISQYGSEAIIALCPLWAFCLSIACGVKTHYFCSE